MPDYSKGQIYKIVDLGFNKCYIGSTVEKLSQRMTKQRNHYKMYNEGRHNYIHLFQLFDEFGVENCKILWIEDYACNSKKELEAREGHHIEINDCVNKRIEGRSKQQWTHDNQEKIEQKRILDQTDKYKAMRKQHYENNKEDILAKQKEDRKNNPEKYKEQNKIKYYKNKEKTKHLTHASVVQRCA